MSQKVLKKNTFEPSTERSSSYGPTMARLRQPFTKKKFVEDIQKPAFDFKKDKAADKLPKIHYGTMKTSQEHSSMSPRNRSMQVIRKLELQTLYNKEHEQANYQSS